MKRLCLCEGCAVHGMERQCSATTEKTRCRACETQYQRPRDAKRNADPKRKELYGGDWPAKSRRLRKLQPWCTVCSGTVSLTVDHPTRAVLCRPCHARLESQRAMADSVAKRVS